MTQYQREIEDVTEDEAVRIRPFRDLSASGLLWLINRAVFHPRGFALSLHEDEGGNAVGWELLGDGREPWHFAGVGEDEKFAAAEATLSAARRGDS